MFVPLILSLIFLLGTSSAVLNLDLMQHQEPVPRIIDLAANSSQNQTAASMGNWMQSKSLRALLRANVSRIYEIEGEGEDLEKTTPTYNSQYQNKYQIN